jgi:cation/acetate symporter
MITGIVFTATYIVWFKFVHPESNTAEHWWFGISPEGIGTVGMLLNFAVTMTVSRFTPPPPVHVQVLVDLIRVPRGRGRRDDHDGFRRVGCPSGPGPVLVSGGIEHLLLRYAS